MSRKLISSAELRRLRGGWFKSLVCFSARREITQITKASKGDPILKRQACQALANNLTSVAFIKVIALSFLSILACLVMIKSLNLSENMILASLSVLTVTMCLSSFSLIMRQITLLDREAPPLSLYAPPDETNWMELDHVLNLNPFQVEASLLDAGMTREEMASINLLAFSLQEKTPKPYCLSPMLTIECIKEISPEGIALVERAYAILNKEEGIAPSPLGLSMDMPLLPEPSIIDTMQYAGIDVHQSS